MPGQSINLQLHFGSHPLHQPQHHQGPQHLGRRAGPSRLRRARRAQARVLAAEQAAAAAAEQVPASSSIRTDIAAEQAAPVSSPRVEKATQVDVATVSAAKADHPKDYADIAVQAVPSVTSIAVQVDCPVQGLLPPPPHAMQGDTLPRQHLPAAVLVPDAFSPDQDYQASPGIPQLDGYTPSNMV